MTDRPARSRWALPLGVAAAILIASVVPLGGGGNSLPVVPLGTDAWLHAAGYAALSASLSRAFATAGYRTSAAIALGAAGAMGFGVGIELLQTAVPTRGFAPSDLIANAAGAALGGIGWWLSRRRFTPREGRPDR